MSRDSGRLDAIVCVKAHNPSPMTLDGTNTYVVEGSWVVDPGPADEGHLSAVLTALTDPAGIVLTHGHHDHAESAPELADRLGVPLHRPSGERVGPFEVVATPGHSADSVSLVYGAGVCFTGDTILGEGSVFIPPDGGSLGAYLDSLRRLLSLPLTVLCPGHGPYVHDPAAKISEYIDHRLERERLLLEALAAGARSEDELLDHAWSDAPAALRPAAALTLRTHLAKLHEEGRLPDDVSVS
jgi:glyoxylase-like metal-dependent hydrolase (beta-lactamase superfamily II)